MVIDKVDIYIYCCVACNKFAIVIVIVTYIGAHFHSCDWSIHWALPVLPLNSFPDEILRTIYGVMDPFVEPWPSRHFALDQCRSVMTRRQACTYFFDLRLTLTAVGDFA